MMVVKLVVTVVVVEGHDEERKKREKTWQKADFWQFWTRFSSCSGHEIHPYI
jgi:hypothetical protein